MKFIHLTVKRFQYLTADSVYVSNLATQFVKCLADDYILVVGNKAPEQFMGMNLINLHLGSRGNSLWYFWFPYIYYFFWLPYFILAQKIKKPETVFFSSDVNLLSILIWWKKVFGFKFRICSDWHMLHGNFKDGFVSKNSEYLVTTSEKLKKYIITRFGVDSNKIKVVYGGVDMLSYTVPSSSRSELGFQEDKKLIGYIGLFKTMGMEKGINTMIEALKYLSQEIVMVFVGAKPGESEGYKDYAKRIGVENRCIFIDIQPNELVPSFEKAVDILVIPYPDKPHFRDFGFPMKVYEYMAAKRPIIYSKLDLVEEVIGDCAVGFEADNAKDLAQKIIEICKDRASSVDLSDRAYNKVKEYSWQKKAEQIINFISL